MMKRMMFSMFLTLLITHLIKMVLDTYQTRIRWYCDRKKWIDKLNAPKGLTISKDKLYIADIDELVEVYCN